MCVTGLHQAGKTGCLSSLSQKVEPNGDRDEIGDFQMETIRCRKEDVIGDTVDDEPVFVSDRLHCDVWSN